MITTFLKGTDEHKNKEAKLVWEERCVKIGLEVIFSQGKDELKGTFSSIGSHLKLP